MVAREVSESGGSVVRCQPQVLGSARQERAHFPSVMLISPCSLLEKVRGVKAVKYVEFDQV